MRIYLLPTTAGPHHHHHHRRFPNSSHPLHIGSKTHLLPKHGTPLEHQTFRRMRIPASPKKAPAPQHDPCHASWEVFSQVLENLRQRWLDVPRSQGYIQWENPRYALYSGYIWVYTPQESVENMGTLLGVHPIVHWVPFKRTKYLKHAPPYEKGNSFFRTIFGRGKGWSSQELP